MKYRKKILEFILLFLIILIIYLIKTEKIEMFDSFIYHYFSLGISDTTTSLYLFFTFLCSAITMITITILCLLFFKNKKAAKLVLLNLINVIVLNQTMKAIFARERPNILMLIDEKGYSFPSGHAMTSTAVYGFFIYLIWQSKMSNDKKILSTVLFGGLIFLICSSRIYLGVHYASDVVAGILISTLYLMIYISLTKKYIEKDKTML